MKVVFLAEAVVQLAAHIIKRSSQVLTQLNEGEEGQIGTIEVLMSTAKRISEITQKRHDTLVPHV